MYSFELLKNGGKMKTIIKNIFVLGIMVAMVNCSSDDGATLSGCDTKTSGSIADGGTLSGYLGDVTVAEDATVTLNGTVTVCSGSTLTVNPGVTVKADTTNFSYLIVQAGADLDAQGTSAKPIVFTSGNASGSRARSDWGGIIINGNAQVNKASPQGEGNTGTYGGTDDTDNSGTIKYVRIEFAGKDFSNEDELNGLCLQGVGSGTTISHLHLHANNDDGIEMFGGNVSMKYIISTNNGDDQIDATYGWRGTMQYVFALPIESKSSNDSGKTKCGDSSVKCGNRAIEFDNNSGDNDATPAGEVWIANMTAIQPGYHNGTAQNKEDLVRVREGDITVNIYNSHLVHNVAGKDCIDARETSTVNVYKSHLEGPTSGCKSKSDSGDSKYDAADTGSNTLTKQCYATTIPDSGADSNKAPKFGTINYGSTSNQTKGSCGSLSTCTYWDGSASKTQTAQICATSSSASTSTTAGDVTHTSSVTGYTIANIDTPAELASNGAAQIVVASGLSGFDASLAATATTGTNSGNKAFEDADFVGHYSGSDAATNWTWTSFPQN